jgi:hypothetical protein
MLMKSESVLASEMTLTIIWLSESEWVALKVRTYGSKPSEYSNIQEIHSRKRYYFICSIYTNCVCTHP